LPNRKGKLMKITVLSITIETVPTAKGSYQKAAVAYKGEDGKISGKNIVSFAHKNVWEVISKAQPNDVYEVKNEKIGENWNWTDISKAGASLPEGTKPTTQATSTPKSTYETTEERAKRQVLIVRQSSLATAVSYSAEIKTIKTKEDLVKLAQFFEAYVFGTDYDDGTIEGLPNSDLDFDKEIS
jgi:hypothetical protein